MAQHAFWIHRAVEKLSKVPFIFDSLRWFLEAGFVQHRRLIESAFPVLPASLLDCGCGTGIYAKCFTPKSYLGIDISADYVEHARRCNPDYRFDVMDATSLGFPDCTFEAVIVSGVIHHLSNDDARAMLSEIWRVLRSEGKLLLWEDVQSRSQLNLVGKLVHRLDLGSYIRDEESYREIIAPGFEIDRIESVRSGFMDYVAFTATKQHLRKTPEENDSTSRVGVSAARSSYMNATEVGSSL